MQPDPVALDETLQNLTHHLLSLRTGDGHWEGELSGSALSTATAVTALALANCRAADSGSHQSVAPYEELVRRGWDWLTQTQNDDGGWGDTVLSISNISTTALCWGALSLAGEGTAAYTRAVDRAASWLEEAAGGLDPDSLAAAIARRYGKDRTFSVPILTMLALAGRLGPPDQAWRKVPQLPFELAAMPHQWYSRLRLPVVSYALPALIAIGQVRHHFRPTRNPITRLARRVSLRRTLQVLQQIQPSSGGFLEAVPLTSFVVMSLIGSERLDHPVAQLGLRFLARSARSDGSWPIDTNLATWLTTLSVNALSAGSCLSALVAPEERRHIRDWLLSQQYRQEHPYTHAPPGGWAWTDLPGGVPDADDTSGALISLHNLNASGDRVLDAVRAGITWLLNLQNRDGGIPTFCRGWGTLPFDRSSPDLTAHALLAWLTWQEKLPSRLRERVRAAQRRAVAYLAASQHEDGSWIPLWFGNQWVEDDRNPTYGTARVLAALWRLEASDSVLLTGMIERGVRWLLAAQSEEGGWGGDKGTVCSLEETGLAVGTLAGIAHRPTSAGASLPAALQQDLVLAVHKGAQWLMQQTDQGRSFPPAPIGFYFARLWYFEKLYPLIFTAGALLRTRDLVRTGSFPT
jgi:squalene-hopene/tetraprenyl-beta-curcumene cyclase